MLSNKLLNPTSGGEGALVENCFSIDLLQATFTDDEKITTGLDFVEGEGLIWAKSRTDSYDNIFIDTLRGVGNWISSNLTNAEAYDSARIKTFETDGFTLGLDSRTNSGDVAFWTFKKQPRFFDVVKYTGNGVAGRDIAHELGCEVGMLVVKATSIVKEWDVYHTDLGGTKQLYLNSTNAAGAHISHWNNTDATDTVFTVGDGQHVNQDGTEYIAYLFAHDPLGEAEDGSGMIACGSYEGNGSNDGPEIDLGWEPQYVMVKASTIAKDWVIMDIMRGTPVGDIDGAKIYPNLSNAEEATKGLYPTSTGFKINSGAGDVNENTHTYIYMAIRRPMGIPESGSEVFAIDTRHNAQPSFNSGFVTDMTLHLDTTGAPRYALSRLTGKGRLNTHDTSAENTADSSNTWDFMDGFYNGTYEGTTQHGYLFKRAKGFFDVVAYTGDGQAGRTVDHNLGVVPDLMIVKSRTGTSEHWYVYTQSLTATKNIRLSGDYAVFTSSEIWNDTEPTDSLFTLGVQGGTNANTEDYIAYLFSNLAGIQYVDSFVGNGTSQDIDMGFAAGARFVCIKATSTTGDWNFSDTTRGIVAGNDPYLQFNTTDAEDTGEDWLDPYAAGITVNEVSGSNANTNGVTYLIWAIS